MAANNKKAELIAHLTAARDEFLMQKVLAYLEIVIQETRLANDTVEPERLGVNQGYITACVDLRNVITRGLPSLPG